MSTSTMVTPACLSFSSAASVTALVSVSRSLKKYARYTPSFTPLRDAGDGSAASGDDRVQQRDVGHRLGHRAHGVPRVRDRRDAFLAVAQDRRPQPRPAGERGGDADRPAGVAAQSAGRQPPPIAAPVPLELPPAMRVRSYGLRVPIGGAVKNASLYPEMPKASSCMLVLPKMTAPASSSFCTVGAYSRGTKVRSAGVAACSATRPRACCPSRRAALRAAHP